MPFADQRVAVENFVIGKAYSRSEIASTGKVSAPINSRDPHWSQGIVSFANAVLFLVTLDKSDREDYRYEDRFEGDSFWWQSQNSQTQRSPVVAKILAGALEPHLFVRTRERLKGQTQRFTYCGRLCDAEAEGERPVTVRFSARDYIVDASGSLREIYDWGRNGTPASQGATRETAIRARRSRGQGYQADPEVNRATEIRAMQAADAHYTSLGFTVTDTHKYHPYDLRVTRSGETRRVEVKGTQGGGESVELTYGEVNAARTSPEPTDLFILHTITITKMEGSVSGSGGVIKLLSNWKPHDNDLRATRFTYQVPIGLETADSLGTRNRPYHRPRPSRKRPP